MAYVNLKDSECSTSSVYSACVIDTKDSRKTRLITLLLDWQHEEEVKEFGCDVTGFISGLEVYAVTWKLKVKRISKNMFVSLPFV